MAGFPTGKLACLCEIACNRAISDAIVRFQMQSIFTRGFLEQLGLIPCDVSPGVPRGWQDDRSRRR
jgi:hypothetical protein